jgi:hypothetical protein
MNVVDRLKDFVRQWRALRRRSDDLDRKLQMVLANQYRMMTPGQRPSLTGSEFSSYSQNGEDGTLLFIFSVIGERSKVAVELCAGDGVECNASNLILNHGWSGVLFDGDHALIERGRKFFARRTNAWRSTRLPPTLVQGWITAENVDYLITSNGVCGEVDLLSLDLDGVDFWIWKAITSISPRVVVLEYNNRFGPDQSVTVPYKADFHGVGAHQHGEGYFGASLAAFVALGKQKGYRLIGANAPNTNAYFMRHDVGTADFPEVSAASCLASIYAQHQRKASAITGDLVTI